MISLGLVGVLAVILAWRYEALRMEARERWREQLGAVADATRGSMWVWREERIRSLRLTADILARIPDTLDTERLLSGLAGRGDFTALWVIDTAALAARTEPLDPRLEAVYATAERALSDTGPLVSGPVLNGEGPTLFLGLRLPGRRSGQAVVGAAHPGPLLESLLEEMPRLSSSDEYRVVAQGETGMQVIESSTPALAEEPLRPLSTAASLAAGAVDSFGEFTTADGRRILAAVRPMRPEAWGVIGRIDAADAYAPARGRLLREALALGGVLTLVAIAGVGASRKVKQHRAARDLAATSLARTEEHYQGLVQNAVFGIYQAAWDGTLRLANPALARILGYPSVEALLAVGNVRHFYADPGERDVLRTEYWSASELRGTEIWWLRADGTRVLVRLSGRIIQTGGEDPAGTEVFVEDITERRALEAQLRQAQKMEAIGQLASGIAHDFNNLLTAVLGSAEMLAQGLPADGPGRADVDEIRNAGRRGTELIRKLLTIGRVQDLAFKSLPLQAVARELLEVLRRVVPASIEIAYEADGEAHVRADRTAIEQILLNLATNARDAMPDGGRLTVSVRDVEPREETRERHSLPPRERYAVLCVRDTGHGMDERTKAKIFEPFFTTKPPGAGSGLGMAMVYGLVRQHGARIDVASQPGRGTSVSVYFPVVHPAAATAAQDSAAPMPEGGSETILLVEDEEAVRRMASRVLERLGYFVVVASTGEEALQVLRAGTPGIDLIISDVVLPTIDGPTLYRETRTLDRPPPFLFTTGYPPGEAGLPRDIAYLPKPWSAAELLVAVRQVLDG